jgi:hypothetical protein
MIDAEERRRIVRHLRDRATAGLSLVMVLAALSIPGMIEAAPSLDPPALYHQAEAAWGEGSYHAALALYQSAHPDDDVPPDVEYNIGNCYFQIREPGLAALHGAAPSASSRR